MLVLSRKPNQKIQIGSEITVTIVKVRGNVIRLGIEAPRDIRVVRAELDVRVDETLTGELLGNDESEAVEGTADELGPRQGQVTFNRYSVPTSKAC